MIFNGHTIEQIDALDEATMNEIVVMYADGLLGNKNLTVTLGTLTAGVFNYLKAQGAKNYTLKDIIGQSYGYFYNDIEASASDSLKLFMSQAPGFDIKRFE